MLKLSLQDQLGLDPEEWATKDVFCRDEMELIYTVKTGGIKEEV